MIFYTLIVIGIVGQRLNTPIMIYKQRSDLATGLRDQSVACNRCLASKKITGTVAYLLLKKRINLRV